MSVFGSGLGLGNFLYDDNTTATQTTYTNQMQWTTTNTRATNSAVHYTSMAGLGWITQTVTLNGTPMMTRRDWLQYYKDHADEFSDELARLSPLADLAHVLEVVRPVAKVTASDLFNGHDPSPPPVVAAKGAVVFQFKDGARVHAEPNGQYRIEDADAKVIYLPNRIRDWNEFIAGSDLLERFIADAGRHGIRQDQLLNLPVELFINWLVVRAAEADGDPPPAKPVTESFAAYAAPFCLHCRVALPEEVARVGARFCCGAHQDAHVAAQRPTLGVPLGVSAVKVA